MARVIFDRVSKFFGDVVALDDMELEVHDREFLVMVGPSGCGKSTALRLVAGLEQPTAGHIYIGNRLVDELAPKDRDVAMVFQSYALYPHMTAFDNIGHPLKLRGLPKVEIQQRVQRAAMMLGVADLLSRKPSELSGGQRQRIALGRAIVRDPEAFLMDEPLSNLDMKLRTRTRSELLKLHEQLRATTIYVTHDQQEAMTMGDRIAVLSQGKLQQLGQPTTLYNHPSNRFVAGFIGSPGMNFWDARVVADDGHLFLDSPGLFRLQILPERVGRLDQRIGLEVTVGVRPENLFLESEVDRQPPNSRVETTVDLIEPLGNETLTYVRLGPDTLTVRASPDVALERGDRTGVIVDTSKMLFFDPKTQFVINS